MQIRTRQRQVIVRDVLNLRWDRAIKNLRTSCHESKGTCLASILNETS